MALKNPDGMSNNPETWKLPCSDCKVEISFEKYHRFQNAKSGVKKGHEKFCEECKKKRIKCPNTKNPEDWKVNCKTCSEPIYYLSYDVYRTQFNKKIECKDCNNKSRKLIVRKDRQYSRDPNDWNNKCKNDDCENIIIYTNLKSYQGAMKRIKDGNAPVCFSCAAKNWERTEEYCEKLRGRTHTEESKQLMRLRFEKMTDEEFNAYCLQQSVYSTNTWNNLSPKEKSVRIEKLRKLNDRTDEEQKRINKILSEKAYERISQYGSRIGFQPAYNIDTIEYIETVLNNTFETTFIHAENGGEFKLFDEELKIHYFADAYCPKLNIWIEFDERHKFKNGNLLDEHIIRHNRIFEILNCKIIRFRIDKHYKTRKILNISEFQINKGE